MHYSIHIILIHSYIITFTGRSHANPAPVPALTDQGNHQRSRRNDLCQQQKEYRQRQQDVDAQGNLLPGVRGQVEHQNREEGDGDGRYDEVDGVEERLASHGDIEGDIRIGFHATCVPSAGKT